MTIQNVQTSVTEYELCAPENHDLCFECAKCTALWPFLVFWYLANKQKLVLHHVNGIRCFERHESFRLQNSAPDVRKDRCQKVIVVPHDASGKQFCIPELSYNPSNAIRICIWLPRFTTLPSTTIHFNPKIVP